MVAAAVAVSVVVTSVALLRQDDGKVDATNQSPTTTVVTSSTTTGPSTTDTTAETTTTTIPPSSPTTAAPPTLLAPALEVAPGAGSGEVQVDWKAVAGATGYRVFRAGDRQGPFAVIVDVNISNGRVTAVPSVVNVYSEAHSYVPQQGRMSGPDRSLSFHVVQVESGQRGGPCYRVAAYDSTGQGASSSIHCASPR
jgi:hypothetical protein